MPISQSATDAIKWFDRCDTSGNWGSAERFASFANAVTVGAHNATAPREVKVLATALYIAAVQETASSSSLHRVVVTPAGRDALVAMCKYATTNDSVEALAKTLLYFITTPQSDDMLLTSLVRDVFVALAKYAVTPLAVGYVSSAIGSLARRRGASLFLHAHVSATTSARDALVTLAPFATTASSVQSLSSAMTEIMKALVGDGFIKLTDEFVTPAVIDAIVSMSPFATSSNAVLFLMLAFSAATDIFLRLDLARLTGVSRTMSRRELHGVIANKRVCDAIISLSKFATTPEAITHLVATIHAVVTEVDSCSTYFANEAFRDAFAIMAPLAASPLACHLLAEAMLAIVARIPHSVEVFASVEVMRGCGYLQHHTDDCEKSRDSADRLLICLNSCLVRGVSRANEDSVSGNGVRGALDLLSQCVTAAVEASQRGDLMRKMQAGAAMPSHQTNSSADQPIASTTSSQLQTDHHTVLLHLFAAVVVDLMYTASPKLPLRRASKTAMLSSGACRQGDALGPLAVSVTLSHPLSRHESSQETVVSVESSAAALLYSCINDTTMVAATLNELQAARSNLRTFLLIAVNRPSLTSFLVHCNVRKFMEEMQQREQTEQQQPKPAPQM